MADNGSPLSDDERAELERLREAQARAAEANRARLEREELARLRKSQRYAEEDAKYYAEKERRRAEREKEREHPDYSLDDVPPMPMKQKVVLAALAVMLVAAIASVVWFNGHGSSRQQPAEEAPAAQQADGEAAGSSAEADGGR